MKKLKSSLVNMVVVLTVISVVAGATLAYVNGVTEGPIAEEKEKKLQSGIKKVILGSEQGELNVLSKDSIDENSWIYRTDKGVAVQSAVNGFGGLLKVLVGFAEDGSILGYTVLETKETPGLGVKADKWFQKDGKGSIIGRNPGDAELKVKQDNGDVNAITASTITSRAFLLAVNQAYAAYKGSADATTGATEQVAAAVHEENNDTTQTCNGKEEDL